ncbi:MAG: DUF2461 domain-containing protein [Arenibacterium sp.]
MYAFDHFPNEALTFIADLRENNRRDWFAENKHIYETAVKAPALSFADAMAVELKSLTGVAHKSKLFRVYRDVRFSKDKTPYNAHIHIAFSSLDGQANAPMWFFGVKPDRVSLGCGVFRFDKAGLVTYRDAMAGEAGAKMLNLMADMRDQGIHFPDPVLKRVPSGYDKEHPHGMLLRRKGLAGWIERDDACFVTEPELVGRSRAAFKTFMPIYRFMWDVMSS